MKPARAAAVALALGAFLLVGRAAAQPPVVIASKSFTESVILGEIAAQLGQGRGLQAQHRAALGGTRLCWDALLAGQIDLYPDYTGTIVEEILAGQVQAPPNGADVSWLRERLAALGVGIVGPIGFDNTYAIGMREPVAARLQVRSISDLQRVSQLKLGFSNEFMSRKDGWPRLRERYGLVQADASGIDHDLAYRALQSGAIQATDLYSTDAEIAYYGLRVLDDDRHVFPRYEAVYLYRLARKDALAPLLGALAQLHIDAPQMRALNAQVKLEHHGEREVAAKLLRERFALQSNADTREPSRWAMIAQRTGEHLTLVLGSLLCAIIVAIPLGVACQRKPRLGRVVLDLVGLVQTIPSLALLVFMIPLLGIGGLPAAVALFLYSLLPIVRNTYTGLCDVPPQLRNTAAALGLPPRAVLRVVELPLASRAILAGIKSAAVINVGTATLGALIGAGGLGQPILTGIRLDDISLILEGAVPASLLAIAVERAFDLLERVVVPKGLRLER